MTAAAPPVDEALVPMEPMRKAVATLIMSAATILVVLDQTIANVALPHMQAALGASPDTINWVLTSYIIATAVGTPLTGWLAGRFGRTPLFSACVLGFTLSSMLCGAAVSLPMMVGSRIAQGFFGAFLLPMSQAFLYDMNKPSRQMRALTLWSFAVMIGPILGPVLGGWITDSFNWRWVFFVNVPIGLAATVGIFAVLPQFPATRRPFDHIGYAMIVVALCGLQLALDRGTQLDWFDSPEIIIEFGLSLSAFWMLFFHLRSASHPIVSMKLLTNRTFVSSTILATVLTPIVVTANAVLPQLLVGLMGYSVTLAGLTLIPRGLALAVGVALSGQLNKFIDGRLQIAIGMVLVIWSLQIQAGYDLQMDMGDVLWGGMLQGLGMGLATTVLNFTAIASVPATLRTEAAALYGLFRNTGTSLTITIFAVMLARNLQINHAELSAVLGAGHGPALLTRALGGMQFTREIAAFADLEINRQSLMIAYIDDFWAMMWAAAIMMPAILLMRPIPRAQAKAKDDSAHLVME